MPDPKITLQGPHLSKNLDPHMGLNLLGHAQMEDLFLGSSCGGHGVCGGDRIRIPKEEWEAYTPPTEYERERLTAQELQEGWRLACQTYLSAPPTKDLLVMAGHLSPTE